MLRANASSKHSPTPTILKRWMGPPGHEAMACTFNPCVGGEYSVTMRGAAYGEMTATGVVTALRKPEHLAYTWRWIEDVPEDEHESNVRIDFIDRGAQTEVIFVHEGFATEESAANHEKRLDGRLQQDRRSSLNRTRPAVRAAGLAPSTKAGVTAGRGWLP